MKFNPFNIAETEEEIKNNDGYLLSEFYDYFDYYRNNLFSEGLPVVSALNRIPEEDRLLYIVFLYFSLIPLSRHLKKPSFILGVEIARIEKEIKEKL